MRLTERLFSRKSDRGIAQLSNALYHSSADASLDDLPERLADLIARFEQADIHPGFRQDILGLLNAAVKLAYVLVTPVHDGDYATQIVADQMAILGRLLVHLQARPTDNGYSILMANTGRLVGLFATREEAERQLEAFHSTMGVSHKCAVVPARVISTAALQPARPHPVNVPPPAPDPMPNFLEQGADNTLEAALRPSLALTPEADLGLAPSSEPGPGPLEGPPSLKIEPRK